MEQCFPNSLHVEQETGHIFLIFHYSFFCLLFLNPCVYVCVCVLWIIIARSFFIYSHSLFLFLLSIEYTELSSHWHHNFILNLLINPICIHFSLSNSKCSNSYIFLLRGSVLVICHLPYFMSCVYLDLEI